MERIEQIKVPPGMPLLIQHPSGVVEEFHVHTIAVNTMQPTSVIRRFHTVNPFIDQTDTDVDDLKTVVMRNTCEVVFIPPCGHPECSAGRTTLHLN